MPKRGRRPGPTQTRQEILQVARDQFAERGYARTTLRSIAGAAGVHPALLHHYFGTKQHLYQEALATPVDTLDVLHRLLIETPREQFAEALVRHFVSTWRDPDSGQRLRASARRIFGDPEGSADLGRAHWETVVIPRIARAFDVPEGNVAVAMSCLQGIVLADSVVGIAQLDHLGEDELVTLVAPVLDGLFRPEVAGV